MILVHQQARAGAADLALVREDAPEGGIHRRVHVAIGKNDVRILAAEFQAEALQIAFGRSFQQRSGGADAAGEADFVDVHVVRQRFAGRCSVSGDDVDDALGNPASAQSSASLSAVSGVNSEGFSTTEQPQASAGASFHVAIQVG